MTNTVLVTVIAGVVEGITEFLPVSSTGHLLLTEQLLDRRLSDLFNIVIQSGAVLAVLPLFRGRLAQFAFQWRERATQLYAAKLALAFVITGIGGLILKKCGFKLPEEVLPVMWALLIGGIAFVVIEAGMKGRKRTAEVTWTVAVAVGLAQLLAAVFPGTSRSGASIIFALILGMGRAEATEFSFLVGIPTMLAAGGYEIFHKLHHAAAHNPEPFEGWGLVVLGTIVSAVVSFVVVKWLLGYVRTHTFTLFGWYRIGLAALIFGLLWFGILD
jgi:undecaprenyl-diphosphatase